MVISSSPTWPPGAAGRGSVRQVVPDSLRDLLDRVDAVVHPVSPYVRAGFFSTGFPLVLVALASVL
jgi:hypothetical protein